MSVRMTWVHPERGAARVAIPRECRRSILSGVSGAIQNALRTLSHALARARRVLTGLCWGVPALCRRSGGESLDGGAEGFERFESVGNIETHPIDMAAARQLQRELGNERNMLRAKRHGIERRNVPLVPRSEC
jgi:hypothetical protein